MNAITQVPVIRNGVDVTKLGATIDAISKQPELARFEFRAKNEWLDGTQNRATVASYFGAGAESERSKPFSFLADEPPVLCGSDEGANPVEYLLSALSMCVTTSIVAHAAARGIVIEAIESDLSGELDVRGFLGMSATIRKGYERIAMTMRIKTDGSADLLRKLADFSPVYDVISRSVPIDLKIETY